MEGDTFQQWKNQCLNKCDFSKKGSVDEDISHIVSFINSHDRYFTTSSCSGRIILFDGVSLGNVYWLLSTRQTNDFLTFLLAFQYKYTSILNQGTFTCLRSKTT